MGSIVRSTGYMVLHRPVELAPFIRWDEKAGLQRDAIRSQWSTRSKRKRKETGYEKDYRCAGIPERKFQGAKADDRLGSGRSLVVLLRFGSSRPSHFGTKTADHTGSDEADLWKNTAESHRTGDRNPFPVGKLAAHRVGTRSDRSTRTKGAIDHQEQSKR